MKDINELCSDYLKGKNGAHRILLGMKTKFKSLGVVGGNYVLKSPTVDEIIFLKDVLRKDYSGQKSVSISLKRFQEAFIGTRFEGIDLKVVLSNYFGEDLISNKEIDAVFRDDYIRFIEKVSDELVSDMRKWLNSIVLSFNSQDGMWIRACYKDDKVNLKKNLVFLSNVIKICKDSQKGISRPAVAFKATADSHMLDSNTMLYKMLLYYMAFLFEVDYPSDSEEVGVLLERLNIIDDIGYRTVMSYGIVGYDKSGMETGWKSFFDRGEPLTLNYQNLLNVCSVKASDNKVYCFENPSVFSAYIISNPSCSAICTAGQINRVEYMLLDKIYECGVKIIYSGDFDPEGLLIAEKLYKRYYGVVFEGYTEENYLKSLSDNVISDRRLKQLEKVSSPDLAVIARCIQRYKKAGYQEYIIGEL